jgi:hypothetical protein
MIKCPEMDNCYKVLMVLDKDFAFDSQYTVAIEKVCRLCRPEIRPPETIVHSREESAVLSG